MTPSTAPVLVIGGGPSGLAVALMLLQNHIPVRIIDKEPHYHISQRASGIWPRTFEAFHFLSVHEIYQTARKPLLARECQTASGTLEPTNAFIVFPHDDPTPSIPYNLMFIGQPAVEGTLRSHLEKYGCSVELGTELQSFEDDGERVLAKLVKKKDGKETFETFEASYLIGADGAKGVTRKQLGLTFLGETKKDLVFVIGDICLEIEGISREHWYIIGDRSSDFIMLRPTDEVAPDGFQFLMTLKDFDLQQVIADEKWLCECMSKVIGREINVRKVVFVSEYRPNIRMVNKFGDGRVFIAGDAAHVHSPTGGQGLNSCVQDAVNLGWKLSLVYKGLSPATLLDSYTKERLPVIAEMLNITTRRLNKLREAPTLGQAMEQDKRMNMLGINYRRSPLVLDEFTDAEPGNAYEVLNEEVLVAGDRAPDAPGLAVAANGAKETRLFDVFNTVHHTVLVFAPDAVSSTDVLEALKKYPSDVIRPLIVLPQGSKVTTVAQADVVVDRDGHAYRGYLAIKGKKKVIVVRPDGVVGAIVHGIEGVGAYFSRIFV